jgi:hypothetical protein
MSEEKRKRRQRPWRVVAESLLSPAPVRSQQPWRVVAKSLVSKKSGKKQSWEHAQRESRGFWSELLAELKLPALFSLFIAIPAAVFGFVAFWENHKEAFEASSAYINGNPVPTKSGYGINLTLSNNGNPPVVIDRAALDLYASQNMPNMQIYYYLPDPSAINGFSADPTRVDAEKQPLPITVNPHSAQTVVLLAQPETLNTGPRKNRNKPQAREHALYVARQEQQEFCDFVAEAQSGRASGAAGTDVSNPTLRLHLKWSGFVFGGPFQAARHSESLEVKMAGAKLNRPSWSATVTGSPDAPTSVLLRHHLAEAAAGGLAKMTLYRHSDPRPIYALERPLVGHTPTAFTLPPLDKSTYLVTFSVDGDIVVSSRLRIPTPRPGYDLVPGTRQTGFCSAKAVQYRDRFDRRHPVGVSE